MAKTKTAAPHTDPHTAAAEPVDPDTETVTLEFRGETFDVPKRRGRWPIDAVLEFGNRDLARAFKELLGDADWRRLTAVAPTLDDFNAFALPAVAHLHTECIL